MVKSSSLADPVTRSYRLGRLLGSQSSSPLASELTSCCRQNRGPFVCRATPNQTRAGPAPWCVETLPPTLNRNRRSDRRRGQVDTHSCEYPGIIVESQRRYTSSHSIAPAWRAFDRYRQSPSTRLPAFHHWADVATQRVRPTAH